MQLHNLNAWEQRMSIGNRCFKERRFDEAEAHYLNALEFIKRVTSHGPLEPKTVGALLVSFENISNLYKAQGELDVAYGYLSGCYQFFNRLHANTNSPHEMCLEGLRRSYFTLMAFTKTHRATSPVLH